ncbi:MAG TPA: hypothetical protein VFF85_14105, partial [Microbacterium sp.]|nr:hypothetical protein [Microbacterium sp.]
VRTRDDQSERVIAAIALAEPRIRVEVAVDAEARVRFMLGTTTVDPQFTAVEGHWVGASLSLFAAAPYGAPEAIGRFADFTIDVRER